MFEEIIEMAIETGEVPTDARAVRECARRYIETEHKKRDRRRNRNEEQVAKIRHESRAAYHAKVKSIVSAMQEEIIRNWTDELLDSTFSIEGVTVTWRDATVAQHETRAEMLEALAAGDLQTAAIHRSAVHDIKARGGVTLAQVL